MYPPEQTVPTWRMALSGLCASLIGIGLSRFAYTPLLPALIAAHWFAPSAAAYLGAANLAGYLAGALLAQPIAHRVPAVWALRTMMAAATAAFFASASPGSFLWFFTWRFLSGFSGGVIMVLAAPVILPHVPQARRGLAAGAIFVGVGCGIAASGTLVPMLLHWGLARTWQGLGVLALILSAVAWHGWPPQDTPAATQEASQPRHSRVLAGRRRALRALYLEYALNAAGLVPHMVFLVDFVARGLEQGLDRGGVYWVLFGLGAVAGPVIAGHVADRIGFGPALRAAFLTQAASVGLLAVSSSVVALTASSIVVGAFVPGIVPLVLGRSRELTGGDPALGKSAWSLCTVSFAVGQAAAAYGLSAVFAAGGHLYHVLFATGGAALAGALIIDIAAGSVRAGGSSTETPGATCRKSQRSASARPASKPAA